MTAAVAPRVKWTEHDVAAWLARFFFKNKTIVLVPNCSWTGHECDLLGVTQQCRVIDVEIKISRSDLKADPSKDKWWHPRPWCRPGQPERAREPRAWPPHVWKHYYAMPADVWNASLLSVLPEASGILTIHEYNYGQCRLQCERRARVNRNATRLDAEDCIDIARLASLRMWDALDAASAARNAIPT